jgi:hypothetical protein
MQARGFADGGAATTRDGTPDGLGTPAIGAVEQAVIHAAATHADTKAARGRRPVVTA